MKPKQDWRKVEIICPTCLSRLKVSINYKYLKSFINKLLAKKTLESFKKGYLKGVLDSEYGQVKSEEILKKRRST